MTLIELARRLEEMQVSPCPPKIIVISEDTAHEFQKQAQTMTTHLTAESPVGPLWSFSVSGVPVAVSKGKCEFVVREPQDGSFWETEVI